MPRRPRLDLEGYLYHIIARGNDRRKIFLEEGDFQHYLVRIRFYARKYSQILYACCLMPNHVHFLIRRGAGPLFKFMQGLQQSYTSYFNKKYRKVGHLFQGRYKSIVCDEDAYFLELVRYIHLNPVRAGLASHPNKYRWTSHHAYRGTKEWNFVETKTVFGELGGLQNYTRFINDGIKEGFREDLHEVKEQRYLGRDQFVEEMESIRPSPVLIPRNVSLAEMAHEVEKYLGLEEGSLCSPSRARKLTPARSWFLYLNHFLGGFPLREVAEFMKRDPSRLSRQWNLFLEGYLKDKAMRQEGEKLIGGLKRRLPLYPRRTGYVSQ